MRNVKLTEAGKVVKVTEDLVIDAAEVAAAWWRLREGWGSGWGLGWGSGWGPRYTDCSPSMYPSCICSPTPQSCFHRMICREARSDLESALESVPKSARQLMATSAAQRPKQWGR